ncbi:NUDIX hydrolase [Agaricicola taiwanensis]|uniref:NUDIX hydrolase n=1 Tax=Agaricicola taiwanensis TaxID=591372 RepID=A0A8J2YEJ4_9RHOB|nr:NUDIX hydrolase [Agaricicola taiwanensis]GGE42480.1 NUDIX hydrolase [Agaricicola taiwanensis]
MSFARFLTNLRDRMSPVPPLAQGDQRQVGAIPFTTVDSQTVFLIITSRRTGRWIFPKGSIIPGMTAWDSAAQEAFEEAGVRGIVEETPIGTYSTIKAREMRRQRLEVDLYPLRLTEQLTSWPEDGQRHRHWVVMSDAKRLLSDTQLVEIIERLDARERLARS